jgi:hypothetical protein
MAKVRDSPVTAADIKEYLDTQDDFDLELHVYRTAKKLGLVASHGGTYEDPVTKKHRQYDVRASAERRQQRIDLAIECKALRPSFPLVVSRIPRAAEESFHHLVLAHAREPEPGEVYSRIDLNRARTLPMEGRYSIYASGEPVGKSTTQVGRNDKGDFVDGDREVFDKWSQALACADDLVAQASDAHERHSAAMFLTSVLPVLVVSDGTLWVADYSEQGVLEREPFSVSEATLFVGRTYSSAFDDACILSHLHIYTRTGVVAFLDAIVHNKRDFWECLFPKRGVEQALKFLS